MKNFIQYLIVILVIVCTVCRSHAQTQTIEIDGSTIIHNYGNVKHINHIGDNYSEIRIFNDGVSIGDKTIDFEQNSQTINITINGSQKSIQIQSGHITVHGNVENIEITSGNINATNVNNASVISGEISAQKILHAETVSGQIITE